MIKPVSGVCDQLRLKSAYPATESDENIEILHVACLLVAVIRSDSEKQRH